MATPFENFVNDELPRRSGVATLPVGGNFTANKYLKTTGIGLTVSASDVSYSSAPDNNTGSGFSFSAVAGENLVAGEVCYVSSAGKCLKAQADSALTTPAVVMAVANINIDEVGSFMSMGFFRNDAWSLTVGSVGGQGLLFLSPATAGLMTQTVPSASGNQVQILGYAFSSTVVYFAPDLTYIENI